MTDEKLLELALDARKNAYVPYSGYAVGAALLAEDEGQRESVEKIRAMLQPQGWKLKEVNLPAMKGSADDEEWEWRGRVRSRVVKMLAARDGKTFPRLEAKLWGEPIPRYEIWCVC